MLDLGDLGPFPAGACGEFLRGQPGIKAQLAEPVSQDLPGLAGAGRGRLHVSVRELRELVLGMRDGMLPHGVEGRGALFYQRQVIRQLAADEIPVAGEIPEQHQARVEDPEVIAREQQP